jgi:energy-converting hydrogenase A subunit M
MVTIVAMEQVGVEDCYTMLMKAVMHRYVTAEDVVPPISREIKDAILKQSLVI